MGSGCKQSSASKYCADPVSSNCTLYEGDPIPLLGICTGDTITEVEKVIIDKLLEMTNGTGIVLSSVSVETCSYIKDRFLGKDKNISNLIQLLIDSECNLKTLIDQINAKLVPTGNNYIFDLKCVTASDPSKIESILQGTIDVLCSLKTSVDNLVANQNNTDIINNNAGNLIKNAITGCTGIKKNGSGSSVSIEFTGMVMPFTAHPFFGPISWFDGNGKGLPGTPACSYYLCNGKNGTPDMRGVVPVGAIQGIPGGPVNPIVDPTGDASLNYAVGVIAGKNKITISKANLPNYNLTGNVSGGSVSIPLYTKWARFQDSTSRIYSYGPDTTGGGATTSSLFGSVAGGSVTIALGGNSQAISTVQPVMPCAWVMRFE